MVLLQRAVQVSDPEGKSKRICFVFIVADKMNEILSAVTAACTGALSGCFQCHKTNVPKAEAKRRPPFWYKCLEMSGSEMLR